MGFSGKFIETGSLPLEAITAAFLAYIDAFGIESETHTDVADLVVSKPVVHISSNVARSITSITGIGPNQTALIIHKGSGTVDYSAIDSSVGVLGKIGQSSDLSVAIVTNLSDTATPDLAVKPFQGGVVTKALIDGLGIDAATVNGLTVETAVPAGALFTDTVGSELIASDDITSNLILLLFDTPFTLKDAPGTGIVDDVTKAWVYLKFNTTAYITNTTLNLLSGSTIIATCNVLGQTTTGWYPFVFNGNACEENAALTVAAASGNPVAGDGAVGVLAAYNQRNQTVFTFPTFAPQAPTALTATLNGANIDLDWTAPATGDSATSYKIQHKLGVGGTWADLVADTGNTNTTYTHVGPSVGDNYYRVYSINSGGTSASPSNEDFATVSAGLTADYTTHALSPILGVIHGYGVALPSDYASNSNDYPLLVFFHGAGEERTAGTYTGVSVHGPLQSQELMDYYINQGFIVIAPQSSSTWVTAGGANNIIDFIDFVLQTYRVNPQQMVWTGLSRGAEAITMSVLGSGYTPVRDDIEPSAIIPIAGTFGNGSRDPYSAVWYMRRESDTIAVAMDDSCEELLTDTNPQEIVFTQWSGSTHGGWEYAYKTGSGVSISVSETPGTDPVALPLGGTYPNTTFPGTAPKDSLANWALTKYKGGSNTVGTMTFAFNSVSFGAALWDINSTYAGHAYIKLVTPNDPAPSKFAMFTTSDYDFPVTAGAGQYETVDVPAGTYDVYCMVQTTLYGARITQLVEDVVIPSATPDRIAKANLAYFGGSVTGSGETWNNSANVQSGTLFSDLLDTTGAATGWQVVSFGAMASDTPNGTSVEDAALGLPAGATVKGRQGNANDVTIGCTVSGLTIGDTYRVILYGYHEFTNRLASAQLESNTALNFDVSTNPTMVDLGVFEVVDGTLDFSIIPDAGKRATFCAFEIYEYQAV